ncbi:SseB family protein [Streptomyces sp. NPDC001595]|uniref:SseB family protein n=1 Tax=Streptomyces sp. NPDC001532 TaxID=3154520 RepID=UPI003328BF59
MSATGETNDLVDVVRRALEGERSPQDVFEAFLKARLYCERPESPGFLTMSAPAATAGHAEGPRSSLLDLVNGEPPRQATRPDRLVPVFSSLEQLTLFTGEGPWFSTTGADLLDLVPPGLGLWLDPAAEHAVVLSSAAVGDTEPVLTGSYRNREA